MPSAPQDEPLAGEAAGAPSSWTGGGAGEGEALAGIDAEIADHLATAAAEMARRGRPLDEAEAISRERFGDVAAVRRKCWWIQQGDQIMFRWLAMALLASLIIAVLGLAVGGWRVQTAVADRIDHLAEELASIHRDQQQLLAPRPAETVPEIRGFAFLDDASRPATDAEIEIWNASEMKLFRRLRTDREGRFRSRSLPPGDYFTLAPLLAENGKEPHVKIGYGQIKYRIQSQPLYVYAGSEPGDLKLDLQLRFGQISFEIIEPARAAPDGDAPTFVYRSQFILAPVGQGPDLPSDPNGPLRKPRWPAVGGAQGPWHDSSYQTRFGGSATEPLHSYPVLMAGQYKVAMMAYPFVTGKGLVARQSQMVDQGVRHSMSGFSNYPAANAYLTLQVKADARTHLKITLPEEIEATWRDLQSRRSEDEKEMQACLAPRPAKIEIVADQPLLPVQFISDVFPDRATP